ncbi:MAG: carboxypeptidase regulatory-like domain-containing protein [Elusimicrobia bacterium]|nr:carboxypeptidase regulatory-like domain-containing protein [Elusimicrobiota bacterium]
MLKFRKFLNLFLAITLFCTLCALHCLYAVQGPVDLTVHTGRAGAFVAILNFDTNGNPDPLTSQFGTADGSGNLTRTINPNTEYIVFATKHGWGPTIRDQMFKDAVHVNTAASTDAYLMLDKPVSGVGQIRIEVVNVTTGAPIMSDVRNVITDEPVTFSMAYLEDTLEWNGTNYFYIDNIPAAVANRYSVNVFAPKDNKALNTTVSEGLTAGGVVTVNFDFDTQEAMAPQTQDTGVTPEGNVAFEGVVVSTNGTGLADMNIYMYRQSQNSYQPDWTAQAMTDSNGRFAFYNVPEGSGYYISINGLGYAGVNDGPRYYSNPGPGEGYGGYTYSGTKIVVPFNQPPADGYALEYSYANATGNTKYVLPAVNGRLNGVVKVGGTALPFANVEIWGDCDRWLGSDMFASSSDTWRNYGSPTNGRVRTGADGTFDIIGISTGNIQLAVWSELIGTNFIYNNNGDWNARNMVNDGDYAGFRTGDDVRVAISSESASNDEPGWIVYSTAGVMDVTQSTPNPVNINIQTGGSETCTITGTIKFLAPATIPATNPIVIIAREEFQGDWSTHKSKSRFTKVDGTFAAGDTTKYSINVASAAMYWVDVRAEYWGIVNKFDTRADFQYVEAGDIIFDFAMAPAGKIRGVVRMPDGTIFKPVYDQFNGRWMEVRARSRSSGGGLQVPDSGVFEITGLVPGLYNVSTWGSGYGYVGPRTLSMDDVMVSANKETYIEIPLPHGVKCEALAPYPMPAMPAGTTGYYYIMGFNSDFVLTGNKIDTMMDSDSSLPMEFEYSLSTWTYSYDGQAPAKSLGWQPTVAAPGRYNMYLIKYEMFGNAGEMEYDMKLRSENNSITIISQAKNVEIKYDPLQPDVTTYIPFEGAVTGKGKISGKITGRNIWTSSDYEKAKKEGEDTIFRNIPTVMLYDTAGTWRGFSGARPRNDSASIAPWELFFMNPNETTKQNVLAKSPAYYYIDMLPPGKYIMVAETPNYPPFMKEVVIYSTAAVTLDLDFDELAGSGISISGIVTSTANVPLEGAEVAVTHKSVEKYTVTSSTGYFSIIGLPKGIFRISVSAPGYALAGDKLSIGSNLTDVSFQLTKADAQLKGVVYSQKVPFAKTIANAKIACYDETYNTQNPSSYLPVYKTKTNKNGEYYISDLIAGHLYKLYVIYPGKIVEYVEITPVADTDLTDDAVPAGNIQDFELKSLPPKLKITVKKTEDPKKFLFVFESPRKLVAPPECWYNSGDSYDITKAIRALPLTGPNNTYSLYVKLLDDNLGQSYNLRVISDNGGEENIEDIQFGGNVRRQSKKEVAEGIAQGDDVPIDELGDDNTQIQMDAGSLTAASISSAESPGRGAPSFAIGGFSSNIPSFKLQGTDNAIAASLISIVEDVVASDVYQIDLDNAQMNKSLTLTLGYDKEIVTEDDMDKLKIYQYNSDQRIWELVPGVKTVDPISGTVSLEVNSITDAVASTTTASASCLGGRAVISNGRFVVNKAAATSQSGIFAVFKSQPPTGEAWTGEFTMFNFPNPFDLQPKIVTLQHGGAITDSYSSLTGINLSTKGTMIKYCLPPPHGVYGNVDIYIYNLAGELVREIDDGIRESGYIYYADWDGTNDRDDDCASGVYFAILKFDDKALNRKRPLKMAIIK